MYITLKGWICFSFNDCSFIYSKSLKYVYFILFFFFSYLSGQTQYYLRGELKNSLQQPILNARITLHSNAFLYHSGTGGKFGIPTSIPVDTITIEAQGYETLTIGLHGETYHNLYLTPSGRALSSVPKLISSVKGFSAKEKTEQIVRSESYSSLAENMFVNAGSHSSTSLALHTDKASYSNIRRFLNKNMLIPPDAIRTDEILNYFNIAYKEPTGAEDFNFEYQYTSAPWNEKHRLLWLNFSSRKIPEEAIPASNLVFLIDVSGSMDMPNRLPMLKTAFKQLVENLREKDTLSIIVYGGYVGLWLQPTSGSEKETIRKRIEELEPGGATPGEAGILTAYKIAKQQFIEGGNNRVIIATDGDFNVGQKNEKELESLVGEHASEGIYLTCLGVGMGNYKDSKLEALSKMGNGNFAYLDNIQEAEKVLVKELTKTLYTVADNVSVTVDFNPNNVSSYRLIGYENRERTLRDTMAVFEGGEIGPGHCAMAVFEIIPHQLVAPDQLLANIYLSYITPIDSMEVEKAYMIDSKAKRFEEVPQTYQLLSNVILFSQLLKQSKYVPRITWNNLLKMTTPYINKEDSLQEEYLYLLEKTKKIYGRYKGDLRKHW